MDATARAPRTDNDRERWLRRTTLALAALGLALRIFRYLQNFPLWCDETMLAANLLDRDAFALAAPLDYHQVCPLGFLALAWASVRVLGFSELTLRLVPILSATLSLPAFYLLARRVFGAATLGMMLAVGLFAVAQPPIRYAAEFKPYATDLLAATLLLWLAWRWREHPRDVGNLWELAVAAPLALALSLPAVFVIAAIALVGMMEVWRTRRISLTCSYVAFLLSIGATVGVMAALGQYHTTPEDRAYFLNFWSRAFPPSLAHPRALMGWLIRTHTGPLFAYPYGPGRFPDGMNVPIAGCFLLGIWLRGRRDAGAVALLVLPFVLALAAAWQRRYPYGMSPRIAQFLVPATLLLTAAGMERLIERMRPASLRRLAAPGIVGLLVLLGVWRFAADLGRPYRAPGDRTAREFARWFWQELNADAEAVCVREDLHIPLQTERWSYDGLDQYLCYQRIYSPRHHRGQPPRWDSVSMQRPLRCVLLNRVPQDVPGFAAWLHENRQRYVLRDVQIYPAFRGTSDEPQQVYVVCNLLPVNTSVTRATKDMPERR